MVHEDAPPNFGLGADVHRQDLHVHAFPNAVGGIGCSYEYSDKRAIITQATSTRAHRTLYLQFLNGVSELLKHRSEQTKE